MIRQSSQLFRAGVFAGILGAAVQFSLAADVSSYFVRKGLLFEQNSAAAPSSIPSTGAGFFARVDGNVSAIDNVDLTPPPESLFPQAPMDKLSDHFEYVVEAPDQGTLDIFYSPGNYAFTFDPGSTTANVNLTAPAYPTAVPQVLNYDAAQKVDPASNFTLNFSPFTGSSAGDTFEFELLNSDGSTLLLKSGSGTSVVIPAGTLSTGETYDARLRFVHNVNLNTTSVPGAVGSAGYFKETRFSVGTTGSGGGGGNDTTPPTLFGSQPQNGATGVALNSGITFIFSEPMAHSQAIQWSANLNPASFTYSWGAGDQLLTATYNGGLPANSTITWALQGGANGFKDVAGNPLVAGAQGSFTTGTSGGGGGTTNNPCTSTNNAPSGWGSGVLFKTLSFTQTGNNNPVPDVENPASAFASYSPATNQTVTAVKVTGGPNNVNITLSNFFGSTFFAFQDFTNAATLDAAIPAGTYTVTATGAGTGNIVVANAGTIPVPKLLNLAELAAFDPTKDFILKFVPFTGATQYDSININITAGDRHFYAPDYCLGRELPNTATSVLIPANTFVAGDKLKGDITFSKFSLNTNSIPVTSLSAGAWISTSFDLTGGGSGSVTWNPPVLNADGSVTFTAQVGGGATTLLIEQSTDLKAWTQVGTAAVVNGVATYTTNSKAAKYSFFRGKLP